MRFRWVWTIGALGVAAAKHCHPKHVHLSAVDENSAVVSFSVSIQCHPGSKLLSTVWFRDDHGEIQSANLPFREPQQYNATLKQGDLYQSHRIYHILLPNLRPNTLYDYKCGVSQADDKRVSLREKTPPTWHRTEWFSFQSLPAAGDRIKLAVIADLGQSSRALLTREALLSSDYSTILLAGDISYANNKHTKWDKWFESMQDMLSRSPLMVTAGNHKVEVDYRTQTVFDAYEARFAMPRIQDAIRGPSSRSMNGSSSISKMDYPLRYEYGNSFYAVTLGNARLLVLNSLVSLRPDSVQYRWLERELGGVDRTVTPWVLVMTHCPMYNSFLRHRDEQPAEELYTYVEPLLVRYRVNLVLGGHVHAYQRTHAVAQRRRTPTGPYHLVVGDGGEGNGNKESFAPDVDWVAYRDRALTSGYAILDLINATHAHWDWTAHASPQHPNASDRVFLVNQYFLA